MVVRGIGIGPLGAPDNGMNLQDSKPFLCIKSVLFTVRRSLNHKRQIQTPSKVMLWYFCADNCRKSGRINTRRWALLNKTCFSSKLRYLLNDEYPNKGKYLSRHMVTKMSSNSFYEQSQTLKENIYPGIEPLNVIFFITKNDEILI